MYNLNIFLKKCSVVICCIFLTACFNAENAENFTEKQSAIAVKDTTQTITLKPLSSNHLNVNAENSLDVNSAYIHKKSHVFIEDTGQVVKLLADDNKGARHQKFLVKVATGQTLLFAHNIDLAPRVDNIQEGDTLRFRGEYVYNPKGGVIHWTHHDPKNKITGGWITHNNTEYK